jgi:hypothetical protein
MPIHLSEAVLKMSRISHGPKLAFVPRERRWLLAQRIIEILIGRLITDEEFRVRFIENPEQTLFELSNWGLELSRTEIAALVKTDPAVWMRTADLIDPRLQKASLKNQQ